MNSPSPIHGMGDVGENSQVPTKNLGPQRTHLNNSNVRSMASQLIFHPRLVKLDFPRYNGEEDNWLDMSCRAVFLVPSNTKGGKGLHVRFGPTPFQDFFDELVKLQHMASVRDYQAKFKRILSNEGQLPPNIKISCFVSGLQDNIKVDVLAAQPATLSNVKLA
ncbi:hypothetical protein Pint_01447 [Pistacia integerrima]|uniref:Uncharacterized protein n=1 Tax=Pistacia integerrima TaxID=434235 RepID=A0ACC0ZL37_9ROSI|nr:hypothetical protein Pint_01447 [Pistacia integerrima]